MEQYLINFGVHSLYQGQSGFVSATIIQPGNLEWTQVIDEANTFNLSTSTTLTELVIESEEPVHTFGFNFNVVHTGVTREKSVHIISRSPIYYMVYFICFLILTFLHSL